MNRRSCGLGVWWVACVCLAWAGCEPPPDPEAAPDLEPALVETFNEPGPSFSFPTSRRTDDASLNAFIERFLDVCRDGRYEEYRLLCSRYIQPLSSERFRRAWSRVRSAEVVEVSPLPALDQPGGAPRAWKMTAHVVFEEGVQPSEREFSAVIHREDDRWVLGKPPTTLPTQPTPERADPTR